MFLNLKNWQTIALASLVIIGPWLIGVAWGLQSAVLSALFASFVVAILIGIAALISLGFALFRSAWH
jgi:hypothetical protein